MHGVYIKPWQIIIGQQGHSAILLKGQMQRNLDNFSFVENPF